MDKVSAPSPRRFPRVLVIGLTGTLVLAGLILILRLTGYSVVPSSTRINALATSNDACVECHRNASSGIVEQFGYSQMAAAKVTCSNCHEVSSDFPGAVEHEGTYVLASPSSGMCQKCHQQEVAQFNQSRHALPSWVAVQGSKTLSEDLLAQYEAIPESQFSADKAQNVIAAAEGAEVIRFACESCHSIGKPAADNSVGQCQKCHLRHEFSLSQARQPETCNNCHIGPDHPQWEIYIESAHGIMYMTGKENFSLDADPGTLTVSDFPAPTCSTCHISGFGSAGTTHDVGERLTWYLFAPVSERRPAWEDNMVRMQGVCLECHNTQFIDAFYSDADMATVAINDMVIESQSITKPLYDEGLISSEPFQEPIQFTEYELWHHFGRTAKFGAWMQGADYTQWHGAYEILKSLAELREEAAQRLEETGQ